MIQHLNENKYHPTNNIEGTGLKHYDCERFSSMVHSLIPENIQKVLLLMFVVVNFFSAKQSKRCNYCKPCFESTIKTYKQFFIRVTLFGIELNFGHTGLKSLVKYMEIR